MEHPEQLMFVNNLMKALEEANRWAEFVPDSTVRDLPIAIISKLANDLKDLAAFSKRVRSLCYTENLFGNPDGPKAEVK